MLWCILHKTHCSSLTLSSLVSARSIRWILASAVLRSRTKLKCIPSSRDRTGERHEPARKTRALRAWQIEEQLVIEQNPLFQPIKSLLKVRPRCRFDGGSEHFEILVENLQVEFQFSQKHVGTIRARQ